MTNTQKLSQVLSRRQAILQGDAARIARQKADGKLTARERIAKLLDAGSFVELDALLSRNGDYSGVITGSGTVLKKAKGGELYDVVIDNDLYYRTQSFSATYKNGSAYWLFVKDEKMHSVATDIPSKDDLDKLDLFKKVRFSIGHLTAFNLVQDLKINDINVTVNTGCYVRLNGNTLRVMSSAHKNARGWAGGSVERSTRDRGEIIWGAGFAVTVR